MKPHQVVSENETYQCLVIEGYLLRKLCSIHLKTRVQFWHAKYCGRGILSTLQEGQLIVMAGHQSHPNSRPRQGESSEFPFQSSDQDSRPRFHHVSSSLKSPPCQNSRSSLVCSYWLIWWTPSWMLKLLPGISRTCHCQPTKRAFINLIGYGLNRFTILNGIFEYLKIWGWMTNSNSVGNLLNMRIWFDKLR